MSTEPDNEDGSGGEKILAAEYVLGLLEAEEHDRVTLRLTGDRALQQDVRFWRERFSALDESFEEVAPPPAVFGRIEQRLFETTAASGPFAGLWDSLALWRGLAAGGLAVALLAAGFTLFQPRQTGPDSAPQQYAAALEADDSDVRFLAVYDSAAGLVRLAALSGSAVEGRDYELWFIEGDTAPVSLGIVPITGNTEVTLPDTLRRQVAPGIVFAVSLEPEGGAPEGQPTGPIVASGAVTTI